MATLSSTGWPYRGAWSANTFYDRGDVVLRSGVLYQCMNNNKGFDPVPNGPPWADVSAALLTLTGSIDPTAGSGVPAAVGSTYQQMDVGLFVKTDTAATDWEDAVGAGGGTGGATILGPFTIAYTSPNIGSDLTVLTVLDPDLFVLDAWMIPSTTWATTTGSSSGFYIGVSAVPSSVYVATYVHCFSTAMIGEPDPDPGDPTAGILKRVAITQVASTLTFEAYPDAGTYLTGVADVYLQVQATGA